MKFRLSPRVALLTIAAVFFLPLVLAWLMYTGTIDFRPHSTRNLGQLVQPPVAVSWSGVVVDGDGGDRAAELFGGHWLILHAVPQPCTDACLRAVADLRQIHRASGRQQSRIRVALLHDLEDPAEAEAVGQIYASFELLEDSAGSLWQTLGQVAGGSEAGVRGNTYLIDPLGNIMLLYAAGYDPNDLKSDLKRLLTWSKLDEQS